METKTAIIGPVEGFYKGYLQHKPDSHLPVYLPDGRRNDKRTGKKPAHAYAEGEEGAYLDSYEDADGVESFSGLLADWAGYLDFDDADNAGAAERAICGLNARLGLARTSKDGAHAGGIHARFSNRRGSRTGELIVTEMQGPQTLLACGLVAEIKIGAKLMTGGEEKATNATQTLKKWGEYRPLYYPYTVDKEFPPIANWDELPVWLMPVGRAKDAWCVAGMSDGKGRHNALIELASRNAHARMRPEDNKTALKVCNDYVFASPLGEEEMAGIYEWVDQLSPAGDFKDGDKVNLNRLSDFLRSSLDVVKIGGVVHVPDVFGIYRRDTIPLRRRARELGDLLPSQRDIIEKDMMDIAPDRRKSDKRYIAFRNGVLDVETDEFRGDWARDLTLTNMVPHDYYPDAPAVDTVDKFFEALATDPATRQVDEGMIDAMYQVIGACLYDIPTAGQAIYLRGPGGCGKSTFEALIQWTIGDDNCCCRTMDEISGEFVLQELYNKKALIGDDISDEHVKGKNESIFKSIIGGAVKDASVKFQNGGLRFHSFATPIFSCNNMPTFADKNDSITRRTVILPFENRFRPDTDEGYRADYMDVFRDNEAAAQYILRRSVEALKKLIANGNYIVADSPRMAAAMDDWMDDQQPLTGWYTCLDDELDGVPVSKVVESANGYLKSLGKKEVSDKSVTRYLLGKGYKSKAINTPMRTYLWHGVHIEYGKACRVYYLVANGDQAPGSDTPADSSYVDAEGYVHYGDDRDLPF